MRERKEDAGRCEETVERMGEVGRNGLKRGKEKEVEDEEEQGSRRGMTSVPAPK